MKKIICVLAAVCLICAFCVPNMVFAASGPAFAVSSSSAKTGGTAEIKISIKNNPGICSARLEVAFDSDLTLNKVTYGKAFGDKAQLPESLASPVVLNWFAGLSNVKADGDFATLSFTVSKSAANGKHDIKVTYNADDVFNTNEDNVSFAVENGAVTVSGGAAVSSSTSSKSTKDSSAKSSSAAKTDSGSSSAAAKADSGSSSSENTGNNAPGTDKKVDGEGDGDPLLGEILFDEDGNEIEVEEAGKSTETVGASAAQSSSKTPLFIAIISAAVLLIGAAAFVVFRKTVLKKDKTQE